MALPPDPQDRIASLEAALAKLIASAKPCPSCHPENDCYVFSMRALGEAGEILKQPVG